MTAPSRGVPDTACALATGANADGDTREPNAPVSAAASTIAGNGASRKTIATNAQAAIDTSQTLCSERRPMRQAACSTRAVTAGLIP